MPQLTETAIFLAAAVLAVPLFRRFKLGAVLGYLAAGVVIGPSVLRLVANVDSIMHFAELGVVLLLFVIGLELQPSRLWVLRKSVFGLGGAQVLLTALVLGLIAFAFGLSWQSATVIGFALAMSSTAFVLQILAERKQLTTRYGRSAFAILLFQDLAVIPLLALIPLLAAGPAVAHAVNPWFVGLKALAVIAAVVVGGRIVLKPVFDIVARADIQEIFTAAALLVVISVSLLMSAVGLSMSLGAFLAGVLLADSEYRHELEAAIEPFKGLLLGLFFISVGMSVDLGVIAREPLTIVAAVIGLMLLKAVIVFAIGTVRRTRQRICAQSRGRPVSRRGVRVRAVQPRGGLPDHGCAAGRRAGGGGDLVDGGNTVRAGVQRCALAQAAQAARRGAVRQHRSRRQPGHHRGFRPRGTDRGTYSVREEDSFHRAGPQPRAGGKRTSFRQQGLLWRRVATGPAARGQGRSCQDLRARHRRRGSLHPDRRNGAPAFPAAQDLRPCPQSIPRLPAHGHGLRVDRARDVPLFAASGRGGAHDAGCVRMGCTPHRGALPSARPTNADAPARRVPR